jgi:glucose-1-phosphate thymidylyltransferase
MRKPLKGLILAGGKGTRLRPITHTGAKQLVPVANKPVLYFGIEAIVAAGISEIGIVVGDTKDEVIAAIGDGSRWGAKIEYIEQSAPLGLAHAVKESKSYLGDSPFVMYLGDNLIIDGITGLVEGFRNSDADSQILLAKVPNPSSFGVAVLDGDQIVDLEEKPLNPKSDLALVGVYMFDAAIWEAVEAIEPSDRGELEITDAIQWLVDAKKKVTAHVVTGWWKDTGSLESMLEANRMVLDTYEKRIDGTVIDSSVEFKVVIEKGAVVKNSTVRGPVIIGQNTVVENAFVGPFTSIYHDCMIKNAEIEHSIVLENSSITDIKGRIQDSLIGKDVTVRKSPLKPKAYRFMLGDSSKVGIF